MKKKIERVITVTSGKGGVGKTVFLLNLAGVYAKASKKVLIIDADLLGGTISVNLDLKPVKTIFNVTDDKFTNIYSSYKNYLTSYLPNIDVLASCNDPRNAVKIKIDDIISFIEEAKIDYDIILIDTSYGISKDNIKILDNSDIVLYIMTNDLMDIKNTKSYLEVIKKVLGDKLKIVLNNSRDINLNYFSIYEIRKSINQNIDYTLDKSLYIKNITSFLIEGEIFTLNKHLTFKDKKDLYKLERLSNDLIKEVEL